ncbi:MAG: signal peptidase I [Candidatus Bathyarchaeia archaeon]
MTAKREIAKNIIMIGLVLLAVQGGWLLLKYTLRTEVPLAYVPSRSMEPNLRVGDLVVIRGVKPEQISNGSIIVFYVPNHYGEDAYRIVHRVIKVVEVDGVHYYETKGDNNPVSDYHRWGYIPESYVIGSVIYRIPLLGYLPLKIREPEGVAFIVLIVAALLMWEVMDSKGRSKRSSDRMNINGRC